MSKIAFIFPGQGSQAIGMGEDFYNNFSEAKEIIDQADSILGFSIKELMFKGPKEELQKTENTQPALLVTSIALLRVLQKEGITPIVCAGHSLGEFSAYVAAEGLTFEDGLRTVRKRGELMAVADPEKKGTMAAIIGLDDNVVEEICQEASSVGTVIPANFNCPGQVVISGERAGVEKGIELAKERKARMAVPLDVSGAFHSPLIDSAGKLFEEFLQNITINAPKYPVIANVTADVVSHADIKSSLAKQMLSSVQWKKSVDKMVEVGADTFIEIGSGKVLQGLVRKTNKSATTLGVENIASLEKTLEKLKG